MSQHPTHLIVCCTCPDAETASRLAGRLVEEGLAACVNLIPGLTSIYSWQGDVQRDPEVLMLIKTRGERFDALADRLRELHPYDLPEIIATPIVAGLPDYLNWVTACTHEKD
jgi:periplasmic divalent cation tolerance protein